MHRCLCCSYISLRKSFWSNFFFLMSVENKTAENKTSCQNHLHLTWAQAWIPWEHWRQRWWSHWRFQVIPFGDVIDDACFSFWTMWHLKHVCYFSLFPACLNSSRAHIAASLVWIRRLICKECWCNKDFVFSEPLSHIVSFEECCYWPGCQTNIDFKQHCSFLQTRTIANTLSSPAVSLHDIAWAGFSAYQWQGCRTRRGHDEERQHKPWCAHKKPPFVVCVAKRLGSCAQERQRKWFAQWH